jgi:hypothetical protein
MKKYIIGCLALCLIMTMGCQKEESFEVGNKPSDGSLLSEVSGDCLPKTVNGTYVAAEPLVPATNTITVSVNVKETGVYTVYTDTVNGYFFRATGVFVTLGTNTVTLRSNGTPFSAGVNNFVVNYDGTSCDIAVTVLPVGTKPAVYTLETTAGNCSGAVVGGSYATTNPLNFTNTVKISVNVTAIGTYNISTTTTNGMTFSGIGSFTTTGVQLVTLAGTGTPVTNGNTTIPLTVGTTTCNFVVPVGNPAIGTLGTTAAACTPATINGTYTVGTALVSTTNTVQVQVNVTTAGVFNISTNTVDGMTFAASGSFSTPTTTLVTLNGTGTPTSSGPQVFTVTFGTSTCTFSVPVSGPAGVAVFAANCAGATVNGTYKAGTPLTAANTIVLPVTVTTAGTYNITTTTVNGMTFTGSGSLTLASTSITLTGSGTPATAITSNIPAPGTAACNVPITVTAAGGPIAVFSANCAGATVNGTYKAGTPLTAANTIVLPVTVTTAGTYNITTTTVNGMTFTGSGSLTLVSTSITLTGSGTPATATTSNIPAPGTAACNIPITVTAAATIDWSFKIGSTTYQGQSSLPDITYDVTSFPPFSLLDYFGNNVTGDEVSFGLIDLAGGVSATEQYATTSTGTVNAGYFYFIDAGNTLDLTAQPADPGPPPTPAIGNMVFVVTSHNTSTKTIVGTFSGTAHDAVSNTTKTITQGTFTAKYL